MNNLQIIRELKTFNAEGAQLEDMVILASFAKLARSEYEARNIPVPEWLDDVNRRLAVTIDTQTRESKLLLLRELEAEEERLTPAGERRARIAERKAALQAELAGATR